MVGKPRPGGGDFWREWEHGNEYLEHRHGVPWYDAPMPSASHCCHPQSRAVVRVQGLPLMPISRCRCGGVNLNDGDGWIDRMTRRAKTTREDTLSRVPRTGRFAKAADMEEQQALRDDA